jgi:large subunit ribosomal protein L2
MIDLSVESGIEGIIASIEYDPNRNARITLINYVDGGVICTDQDLNVGDKIMSGSVHQ